MSVGNIEACWGCHKKQLIVTTHLARYGEDQGETIGLVPFCETCDKKWKELAEKLGDDMPCFKMQRPPAG